jgi:hypothetical protein
MIVFDLLCGEGHRFEGWFGSAADFSAQKERRQLACPRCGIAQVERVPSASRVNLGVPEPKAVTKAMPGQGPGVPQRTPPIDSVGGTPEMEGKDPFAIAQMLYSRMLDELLTKSEDVGKEFPAEARKIFYQEAPARVIRGEASAREHEELLDEGIPVARLPLPPGRLN